MTSVQRIIWTACPNGITEAGRLRISVAIGPQLRAGIPAGGTATLGLFPDWLDWPATPITWQAVIDGAAVDATVVSAAPSTPLYRALFSAAIPVDPFEYQSPSERPLYSYPASYLHGLFNALYTHLAATVPKDGGWHSYHELVGPAAFGQFPVGQREFDDLLDEVRDSFPEGGGPIDPKLAQTPGFAAAMAYLFTQPLGPASTAPPPVPTFDFHQAYSLLQRHPGLLRLFGFVVDLEIARPSGLPTTVSLSVAPHWTPKLGATGTTNVTPVTMTTAATWLAAPRPSSPVIGDGLLRLSDPGAYQVLELDVDGATAKSLNFVQSISYAHDVRSSADTPTSYGAPALRSAGLSLSMTSHAQQVYGNWLSNDDLNAALPGPVTLYAEDIAQGYRVDVWDSQQGRWFQLCARTGNPQALDGYGIGRPAKVVKVPAGDEGWIEPAITEPPGGSGSAPVYLPETMLRWDGWSLVASRPGKHLSDDSADSLQGDAGNAPPANADFQLRIDYAAAPGTLPTLRFARSYRFRARVVDLAGNSVPFNKTASVSLHTTDPVSYGRLEPVASPVVVPTAPKTLGESLETLVIRSNYNIADDTVAICERHLAPPGTSIELAQTHGAVDSAGRPGKAVYATLAARDGLTYKSAAVRARYGGRVETVGSHEWVYYPSDTDFGVPYLPDVLGCGASLLGLPGAGGGRVKVEFGTGWPDRRAIRLVVRAGSGTPTLPGSAQANGALTVHAPKASVSTVRLSSWFEPGQLESLKLWQWLDAAGLATPALKALVLEGGHYMLTPYRELTIVHAVQQPLAPPTVGSLTPSRDLGTTYAFLNGLVRAHPPSTQRVDILSSYTDPYDDGESATGVVDQAAQARVAELALESDAADVVPVKAARHDFGDTKHHSVYYSLLATTRFQEYFADTPGTVFTRSSLEADAHPPTSRGYPVVIPSSQRPPAPDVRYLIPAFGWQRASSASSASSRRVGNLLRVYLGRPWFQTGAGEYLGVIVANPVAPVTEFPPGLAPYVSGYGQDPVFAAGLVTRQPELADFKLATFLGHGVQLAEQTGTELWAGVAGHDPAWDAARKLWYADIAINPDPTYFPFVKLALVRYQPQSLDGIKVSRVVQADFIQVAPDRAATVTYPSPTVVRVTVSGPGYLATTDPGTPDTVRAYVQEATVKTSDPDLSWTTVPSSVSGTPLAVVAQTDTETIWKADVKLPSARGTKKYRLLLAESEQHKIVAAGNQGARVTYLDAIEV
jgi:hypothetical protein